MDFNRRPPLADPDFDPTPPAPVRLRALDPAEHRRLVVNPFLAVLALIGLARLARALFDSPFANGTILLAIPLALLPYLVQYHCLDCGRTGSYPRHARHACPGLLARMEAGRPPRFPFPRPRSQLVVWGWALGSLGLLLAVVLAST